MKSWKVLFSISIPTDTVNNSHFCMESPLAGRVCAISQDIHVTISNITLAWTANMIFTTTTEIHACSLVNFYCQYADRHKFEIHATRQRARAGNSTICYWKKQFDVSFQCVCPVIDNELRHNIVKVDCGSKRLSPRASTATLTMLWRNSWSITGQTHKKLTSRC